ncbi:flagellar basal-body rod protein FlgG [Hylemonella sp. W303a]|uniref:flagellar basal-body rod protein FlgG n=1 Tax=Hylemonella sp. W303a TaxID=3389873 RepID=UPI00396B24CE
MFNALWIAKTGMEAQQRQLDTISNNLANSSTNGFKRSSVVFEDLMYQNLRSAGSPSSEQTNLPTGLQVGLGARAVATSRNYTQGNLVQGRPLDVAVNGNGFFQISMPDGTTQYTRDGALEISATGALVTSNGLPLADGIVIPPNASDVSISEDGTVTAKLPGQVVAQTIGNITLATFINPAGLEAKGQNLFAETAASGTPSTGAPNANGIGKLMQGYLESSNVNVVQELVTMIQTQRAYEMNSKAIQTSDQMLQKLGQL